MWHRIVGRCLAGLVAGAAVGCGGESAQPPMRFGVLLDQHGGLADFSRDMADALVLAAEEINRGGGLLGRELTLQIENDGGTPAGAVRAYTTLIAGDVAAVIGPIHSAGVIALAGQIRNGQTITLSGTVTSPEIATMDDDGYFFRTVPSDTVQGIVLADQIVEQGREHVCIVYREESYGQGLYQAVVANLPETVVVTPSGYDPALPAADLPAVMDPCEPMRGEANPAVVFITYLDDGRYIMQTAADLGWTAVAPDGKKQIFLVDANKADQLFQAMSPAQRAAFVSAIGTASTGADAARYEPRAAFETRFKDKYGYVSVVDAPNHYDALYLAAAAIQSAGSLDDRPAIARAMASTATGADVEAGDWAAIAATIDTYRQCNYQGASGPVDLDVNGELRPPYYVTLWTVDEAGHVVDTSTVTINR